MPIPEYHDIGSLDILAQPDTKNLVGKSVIVTGGASGLGKAYAEAFAAAG